jgi:20S proteasome alpha/beta subunit
MTIITVVCVPEGIAMTTDSRLIGSVTSDNGVVHRFNFTDNAQKLLLIRHSTLGISFCGDAVIEGKTVADFLRVFDVQHVEEEDTVPIVAKKLNAYLASGFSQYNVAFYLAGYDHDEPFVYLVNKDGLIRKNYLEDEKIITYSANWHGETGPINRLLHETRVNFKLMPLKDAIDFAEFIIDTTIDYLRFAEGISTCGGPIDSLVITKDYTKFLKHKILQP